MSAKEVTGRELLKLCLIISVVLSLGSCGPLPKEGHDWLTVSLNISTAASQRISRTGTENRRTEYVLAVESSIPFSASGPPIDQVEDSNLVTLTNNTTTLSLPVGKSIKLLVFRYSEYLTISQLNELLALQQLGEGSTELGIAPAIDFGQSEAFEIAQADEAKTIPVWLAPDITGKLAQTYVQGATVWADRLEVGSNTGNFQLDADEVNAISDADGNYSLAPPSYHDFLLVTDNGSKPDASGRLIPAAPMLAPLPRFGQRSVNITPLTTLVATEPLLKDYLETLGDWNVDVADPAGIPGGLLKISLLAESFSTILSSGSSPVIRDNLSRTSASAKLADALHLALSSTSPVVLNDVVKDGLQNLMADSAISRFLTEVEKTQLESAISSVVFEIEQIPADDLVKETDVLSKIENKQQTAFDQLRDIICGDTASYLNFTPVIESISMQYENGALRLVGLIDDDNYAALEFNWLDDAGNELDNVPSSYCETAEAIYPDFSPDESNSFTLKVTDPGIDNGTASCTWAAGATFTECQF